MMDAPDPVVLAHKLAEIARKTKDEDTGRQLMDLVVALLEAAGLPVAE
jgi:hypothetical protein